MSTRNSLIDIYEKCGSTVDALRVFNMLPNKMLCPRLICLEDMLCMGLIWIPYDTLNPCAKKV